MEVVSEPNTMSDCIKAFLEDPQWPQHIKDPQNRNKSRGKPPQTYNNICNPSS